TTHKMADREPSTRGSAALKIRRSWVQIRDLLASSTAAKYSSRAALQRSVKTPNTALTCSTSVGDDPARGSGRRGRRFKSCHPDHSRRSLTCGNAVSCARFSTFQQSRQRPRGNKKEHEGTKRKAGADFDGQKNTGLPARRSRPSGTEGSFSAL